MRIWAPIVGRPLLNLSARGRQGTEFLAAAFSPDHKRLALAGDDDHVHLWLGMPLDEQGAENSGLGSK